ncbi:MAG: hypothetical protein AB1627_11125 [Chloroflexota bacterium]
MAAAILASAMPTFLIALLDDPGGHRGADYLLYMGATQRWLDGGGFYLPHQVIGPYQITFGDVLYPPVALWLFTPFTVLPAVLWWLMPLAAMSWAIAKHRPRPVVWPLVAVILAWQPVEIHLVSGNPDMWASAAVALGTVYQWPAVFAFIKPSITGLFGLWGMRHRSWWVGLGVFALLCAPFGTLWADWVRVILNGVGAGVLYGLQESPIMLLPIVAWAGRTDA